MRYILQMSQGFLDYKQWLVMSKQESSGVEESGSNAESQSQKTLTCPKGHCGLVGQRIT